MGDHVQGQPGADRAIGRPGPAARMNATSASRPRPSVLITPVRPTSGQPRRAPAEAPAAPAAAPSNEGSDYVAPALAPTASATASHSNGGSRAAMATLTAPAPQAPPATSAGSPTTAPSPTSASGDQSSAAAAPRAATSAPAPTSVPATAAAAGAAAATAAGRTTSRPPKAERRPEARTQAAKQARRAVEPAMGPRSARLYVTHVDPWSVMKQAFLLSLALAVILLVAAAALWFALDSAGVLDAITRTATEVGGESGSSLGGFLELGRVMGAALVLAGIETVLVTALATLFAFMYNLAVGIGGGLEVTLSEDL